MQLLPTGFRSSVSNVSSSFMWTLAYITAFLLINMIVATLISSNKVNLVIVWRAKMLQILAENCFGTKSRDFVKFENLEVMSSLDRNKL